MSMKLFLLMFLVYVMAGSRDVLAGGWVSVRPGSGVSFHVVAARECQQKSEVFWKLGFLKRWEPRDLNQAEVRSQWKAELESKVSAARSLSISA